IAGPKPLARTSIAQDRKKHGKRRLTLFILIPLGSSQRFCANVAPGRHSSNAAFAGRRNLGRGIGIGPYLVGWVERFARFSARIAKPINSSIRRGETVGFAITREERVIALPIL